MKLLRFIIRKWFQRVCACGHSPVAHEHYSRNTSCPVCPPGVCVRWRARGWRLK